MPQIAMRAAEPLTYRGRTIQPGEDFFADPNEAAALKYQRKADFSPGTTDIAPQLPPSDTRTVHPDPVAQEDDGGSPPKTRRSKGGRYQRADLRPEE